MLLADIAGTADILGIAEDELADTADTADILGIAEEELAEFVGEYLADTADIPDIEDTACDAVRLSGIHEECIEGYQEQMRQQQSF